MKKIVRIGEIAEVKGGKRLPKGKSVQDEPTNHPYLRVTDFEPDGLVRSQIKYIDGEAYRAVQRYTISHQDVYISIAGTIGRVGIVPADLSGANLTENAAKITQIDAGVDHRYLMYYLRGPIGQAHIAARTGGSSQPKLALYKIAEIEVPLPPLSMQKRVADQLSALESLIENNIRRIAILEEMARVIYREWLVNFRFPGHDQVEIVESDLGLIPEGWQPSRLGDIAEEVRRAVDPEAIDPDTPYFGLGHLPKKSIALSEWGRAADVQSTKLAFNRGEILFGKIRPYFHKVGPAPVSGVCSSDTIVIVPRSAAHGDLVLFCVSSEGFVDHATQTSQGTKMPRANWNILVDYPVALPPDSVLERFNNAVGPLVMQIRNLISKNRNLRQTRDLLLPKLISGEIDVSSPDEALEAAVA